MKRNTVVFALCPNLSRIIVRAATFGWTVDGADKLANCSPLRFVLTARFDGPCTDNLIAINLFSYGYSNNALTIFVYSFVLMIRNFENMVRSRALFTRLRAVTFVSCEVCCLHVHAFACFVVVSANNVKFKILIRV